MIKLFPTSLLAASGLPETVAGTMAASSGDIHFMAPFVVGSLKLPQAFLYEMPVLTGSLGM